ncbi:hypothetical protein ACLMJK_007070 [Lecanora helva]
MSGYPGRKAPNVSQYMENLNAIPSTHDVASEVENSFDLERDLALFTNTEFLDFDATNFLDQSTVHEYTGQEESGNKDTAAAANGNENEISVKGLDFVNDYHFAYITDTEASPDNFSFPDLNSYIPNDQPPLPPQIQTQYPTTAAPNPNIYSPTTNPPPSYPSTAQTTPPHPSPTAHTHPTSAPNPSNTETATSRLLAEEDKRRRNTAASARFRVKKKQREQALEQTAKDLESKTVALEQRIGQLETENEWLRGLVVEKHGGEREDLRLKWRKRDGEGKKGVGTGGTKAEGTKEEGE